MQVSRDWTSNTQPAAYGTNHLARYTHMAVNSVFTCNRVVHDVFGWQKLSWLFTAAVTQWVRALAPQAEGWNLSRDRPKTTAKRSTIGVGLTGPRKWPL